MEHIKKLIEENKLKWKEYADSLAKLKRKTDKWEVSIDWSEEKKDYLVNIVQRRSGDCYDTFLISSQNLLLPLKEYREILEAVDSLINTAN